MVFLSIYIDEFFIYSEKRSFNFLIYLLICYRFWIIKMNPYYS